MWDFYDFPSIDRKRGSRRMKNQKKPRKKSWQISGNPAVFWIKEKEKSISVSGQLCSLTGKAWLGFSSIESGHRTHSPCDTHSQKAPISSKTSQPTVNYPALANGEVIHMKMCLVLFHHDASLGFFEHLMHKHSISFLKLIFWSLMKLSFPPCP